jgi:LuxR family maltose regulon positive regulatory protein
MDTHTSLPILFPKVQIPPSRLKLVSRQRLLRVLDEGLHRKLTLISAPAGYGKSTLLSEWAATCQWPLGWVTLEPGDNDIERFLAYFMSAVQVTGVSASSLESMLGARFSLQPLPQDALLAILVNQLPTELERLVIVLDDYHYIDNQEIHSFISALLDHLPTNIHLIIATRADPPLRLARLRAKDQLNELTTGDLRFTLEETKAFFAHVMGLHLPDDQIANFEARTEGWITGLQLAGLSLKERQQPVELIDSLSGTHRYILDYLLQEVFSDLPVLLQTFLMRVSILERLSPELCQAVVSGLDGSEEMGLPRQCKKILEFMDVCNLFIVPLDNQRQWYRFHPLFADFLRDRLATQRSNELPELHRRAAAWYAHHGLISEAVRHSIAGEDIDHAADFIQAQAKDLLTRGEFTTLLSWTETLPEEMISIRPQLGLARAWGLLMRNPVEFWRTIAQQSEQIAAGFGITPQELLSALAESEPGSLRQAELGEFAMLQAFARRDSGEANETIRLFEAALEYLPESEPLLRGFTLAGLASTYARTGAIKAAEQTFAQGALISLAANSTYGYVACSDWQATMQAEQGQLKRAAVTYRQAIEKLSGQSQRPLPLSGHVYIGLASVLFEQNDLVGAVENVETGLKVGVQVKDIDALLMGYAIQARTLQALGNNEKAHQAMQEGERFALGTQNPGCIHETQARKAELALADGDVQTVQDWAAARGMVSGGEAWLENPPHEIEQFTYARLLVTLGKASEALSILQALSGPQEQTGRNRVLIENLALQAVCLRSLGRMDEALRTLARALLLAEPEGFVRVFIQEGPEMAALLRTAGTQGHSPKYVRYLLEAFGETSVPQEAVLDPLSERELEVLRLVAQGLTNAEIAVKLVIAHSTVKTHINRIYAKLGTSTRTQAVARARQLQILP